MPSRFYTALSAARIDQEDAIKQASLLINWIIIEVSPDHILTDWKARVGGVYYHSVISGKINQQISKYMSAFHDKLI